MQVSVEHLTPALIERLDRELARAIADVDAGRVAKAKVALSFSVGIDEDAKTEVVFTHSAAGAAKGSFQPTRQARLPLEEEDDEEDAGIDTVTVSAAGREVTLTGRQFDAATRAMAR